MQSRQEASPHHRNRATGFTDADWGALEKRLSDTRDMLRDILSHLRKVLDNLKTAGEHYQSAGRAWRRADQYAQGSRRQYGHRQNGPTADAQNPSGAGSRHQSTTTRNTSGRFQGSSSSSTSSSTASGSSRFNTTKDQAGSTSFGGFRASGQASSSGTGAGERTFTGSSSRASHERQAGNGFSWSWRTRQESGSTSSGTAGAGASAGSRTTDSRAGASAGGSRTQGEARGASGKAWNEQKRAGGEHKGERHRTTGPGQGSSYQDYSKRNHKSPLGNGRMTLTQACALLCVTYPCTADDVKNAYRKQARRHHPDLGGDEEMMKSINQAYELALSWCSPLRGKTSTWAA